MPHKKNPIVSENITGIARVLRGYVVPAMENNSLWYERDISHSSVERIIIPDATNLLDYALTRYTKVIDKLIINEDKMLENINLTNGIIFSQRVLNELIEKGMDRIEAYDVIQKLTHQSWNNKEPFINLVMKEFNEKNNVLKESEIKKIFNIEYFLKKVDIIFKRVFFM